MCSCLKPISLYTLNRYLVVTTKTINLLSPSINFYKVLFTVSPKMKRKEL